MTEIIRQGTLEWAAQRCGRATGSRIADILAKLKNGDWGASRANYKAQLTAERLTGVVEPTFQSQAMKEGTEKEPDARAAYCFFRNAEVEEVGFCNHPTIDMAGASADGLVGSDGIVEIKAPLVATHIETLRGKTIPGKYRLQSMWNMACRPERKWVDYVSYNPAMPQNMQLFVERIHRDNAEINRLENEVMVFLREVDAAVRELKALYGEV